MRLDNEFWESLRFVRRNETDGFRATTVTPKESGLPADIVCNYYGMAKDIIIPWKHRKMIVEIGDANRPRFWEGLIPVSVSETPKILLKGKKLKRARTLFSEQDWDAIFSYIARNRHVIERHWTGELSSFGLFQELE